MLGKKNKGKDKELLDKADAQVAAKEKKEEVLSSCDSTNHTAYIVEVRIKPEAYKNGCRVRDKYDFEVMTDEWDKLRLNKVEHPAFQSQYPLEEDYFCPRGETTLTWASAHCIAYGVLANDKDRVFEVRVRPCRVNMSWKITKRDDSEAIDIKSKPED